MPKILGIVLGVLLLLVAAVLVAPSFWNWNSYRGEIASRVEAATGRDFAIDGDISLAVVPSPTLSAARVRFANPAGAATPDMATLDELRIRLAFWPLLRGEIQATSVELVRPAIRLERMPDGRANWEFAPEQTPGDAAAAPESDGESDGGLALRLDRITIRDGSLTYRDAGNDRAMTAEQVDAQLSAESLAGPFRGSGDMVANAEPVEFAIEAGRIGTGDPIPATVRLSLPRADARLDFAGTLNPAAVAGSLKLAGSNLASFVQTVARVTGSEAPSVGVAQAFAVETKLAVDPGAAELTGLSLVVGETRATGGAKATLGDEPSADLALTFGRLDLDAWMATMGGRETSPTTGADVGGAAQGIQLPTDLRARVRLVADAVLYNGGLIRDAALDLSLADGAAEIRDFSAQFPGAASAKLSGSLTSGAPWPRFQGAVEANAGNLRGVLEWLGIALPAIPPDRMRSLAFSANVAVEEETARISNLRLQLDAARASGGATVALADRVSFGLSLVVDRLNLDAYLPKVPAASAKPAESAPAKEAPGTPLALLAGFDANLQARIDQLTYKQVPIQGVMLDAVLFQGKLELREASVAELAGGRAKLTGNLGGFGGSLNGRIGVDGAIRDVPRFLDAFGVVAPAADRLDGLTLKGTVAGDLAASDIDFHLGIGQTAAKLSGKLQNLDKAPRYMLAVSARDESMAHILAMLAPELRLENDPGAFGVAAKVDGDAGRAALSDIDLSVGPMRIAGNAAVEWDGAKPVIEAKLTGNDILLDPFLGTAEATSRAPAQPGSSGGDPRWSAEPLDLSALREIEANVELAADSLTAIKYRVDDPRVAMRVKDGVLDLSRLDGRMFDGGFAMTGRLSAAGVPSASGKLTIDKAKIGQALFTAGNIDVADGVLDYSLDLATSGSSPRDMVGALAGQARLAVRSGTVNGFDLKAVSDRLKQIDRLGDILGLLTTAMSGGQTRFERLDGTFKIENGVAVSNDLHLVGEAGEGQADARIDLPEWRIAMTSEFNLTEHPKAPAFGMELAGPLDSPQRRFHTEEIQAYLVQRGVGSAIDRLIRKPDAASGQSEKLRPEDAAKELFRMFQR